MKCNCRLQPEWLNDSMIMFFQLVSVWKGKKDNMAGVASSICLFLIQTASAIHLVCQGWRCCTFTLSEIVRNYSIYQYTTVHFISLNLGSILQHCRKSQNTFSETQIIKIDEIVSAPIKHTVHGLPSKPVLGLLARYMPMFFPFD